MVPAALGVSSAGSPGPPPSSEPVVFFSAPATNRYCHALWGGRFDLYYASADHATSVGSPFMSITLKKNETIKVGLPEWTDIPEAGSVKTETLWLVFRYIPVVLGDLNGDGKKTIGDGVLMLRMATGAIPIDAEDLRRADLDGDGRITAKDATRFMKGFLNLP